MGRSTIQEQYYLSSPGNLERASHDSDLSACEIESMVGRFTKLSHRAGQLRGKVVLYHDKIKIMHHFTGEVFYECELV